MGLERYAQQEINCDIIHIMEPTNENGSHIEEFRRRYEGELVQLLDSGLCDEEPLPPDPSSMGLGKTSFEELSDEEIAAVRKTIFEKLGVNPLDPEAIQRTYTTQAPPEAAVPGKIDVKIFGTNRDGTFLQEMTYQDGKQRWVVGPDSNI